MYIYIYPRSMSLTKYFLVLSLVFSSLLSFSQSKDGTFFLKWKLKPKETLVYKTVMKEIDTVNHKDLSMDNMMRAIGVRDSTHINEMRRLMTQLNKEIDKSDLVTKLTERRKGIVDIEMAIVDTSKEPISFKGRDADDSLRNIGRLFNKMSSGISLRGAVNEDGSLESFYIPNGQRNLVCLFFELPAKSIKPGDSWSLNTYLITLDQHFECDTSYRKNQVIFNSLETINNEHIANIQYDIVDYASGDFKPPMSRESIKTTMKMTYRALAKFSIERGRWISYDGLMSLSSSGISESQSTKKFSLIIQ